MIGESQPECGLVFPIWSSCSKPLPSDVTPTCEQRLVLLIALSGTARWGRVLLNLFLGLVCLLLLLLQVGGGGEVRSGCTVRILLGIGGRAGGNTVLALIFGK